MTLPAPRGLCLFDLDETLLPFDSDHAWGNFLIRIGWVDESTFRDRNDAFFADYQAGRLDIHGYIAFATSPMRAHGMAASLVAREKFMQEIIRPGIYPRASALIQEHIQLGDLVALVTATNEFVTEPIAKALGIKHLIAIRLERDTVGEFTGSIDGVPSYREGKVTRVEQWLAMQQLGWTSFTRVSVYSDSANDLPLLERATHPVATNPSPALLGQAQARGWRTLRLFE